MPDVDGTSVCWEIREVSEVPVLFLSAYADTEDRIRGLLAGGDDYMGKPYSLEELELRLRRHIERRQKRESREVLSHSPRWNSICSRSWRKIPGRYFPTSSYTTGCGNRP